MIPMVCDETIIIKRRRTIFGVDKDIEELTDINQHLHDCIY